jgi:tetratricopeptide (TPR) repeat protein
MDRPGTASGSSLTRRIAALSLSSALLVGCSAAAAGPEADRQAARLQPVGAPIAASASVPSDRAAGGAADPARLRTIGLALVQQARETGDPSDLGRAEEAFRRILATDPDDLEATIGLGSIALTRHQFAEALELGKRAEALAPGAAQPLGIQVDALIELGRTEEAGAVLERMLRARPDLASYARLSYYHELHGRLDAAIDAMERAVVAGGAAIENTEYARVLLGDLWLLTGDAARAEALFTAALEAMPGYVPALRGLARIAVGRGELGTAIQHLEEASARTPLPDVLIALGEAQDAAGRGDAASVTFGLVTDIESLFRAAGVAPEPAQAVFEADHGDPSVALELAEAAYRATPSIRAADALGWALHHAGRTDDALRYAREAVALGTLEPSFHYHLGVIEASLGHEREAVAALTQSLSSGTGWSALHAPRAAELLGSLS